MRPPRPLVVAAAIATLCAIWGSTWLVIRHGLHDLPPLHAAAARFAVAAVVFAAIAPMLARREGGRAPPLWLSSVPGTLNFAASYGIVYWGEQVIPSGLASVLFAVFPLVTAYFGHLLIPNEKLDPRIGSGFLVGFAGIVVIFATDLRAISPGTVGVGAVFLISPIVSGLGQSIIKRYGTQISSALLNRDALIIGAAWLALAAFALEPDATPHWTQRAMATVVYLALAGTVLTFGLYYWLLRHFASHRLSLIAYTAPIIALLLSWITGESEPHLHTVLGSGLILVGVAVATRRPR